MKHETETNDLLLLTVTAKLIPEQGIGVHIRNEDLPTGLMAEALGRVAASCQERIDMLLHETVGGAPDTTPGSAAH